MTRLLNTPLIFMALFSLCFLTACQEDKDLLIVGEQAGRPIFCVSSFLGKCSDRGDWLDGIIVNKVDMRGQKLEQVWAINCEQQSDNNCVLDRLVYGTVPRGWRERQPAEPLSKNTYYSFNAFFFIYRDSNGDYSVVSGKQFYRKENKE